MIIFTSHVDTQQKELNSAQLLFEMGVTPSLVRTYKGLVTSPLSCQEPQNTLQHWQDALCMS